MRSPALVPAVALVAGAAAGIRLPAGYDLPLSVLATAAHLLAVASAWASLTPRLPLIGISITFLAVGVGLGAVAERSARHPPLLALFERFAVTDGEAAGSGASVRNTDPSLDGVVEGVLDEDASPGAAGVSLRLLVERVMVGGRWNSAAGGAVLTVGGTGAGSTTGSWRRARRIRAPASLRLPSRYQDPGVGDHRADLARRGAVLTGSIKSGLLVEVVARGWPWQEWAADLRALVRRAIDRHAGRWSKGSAGIVTAILIGDRAGLGDETQRRLQQAGTFHVIAISGGNIAILAALLVILLTSCGLGPRAGAAVTIAGLVVYAYVVGGGASVIRATVMAGVYLSARLLDHRSTPVNALGVACVALVACGPLTVIDAGFTLTFGATAGILVGSRLVGARLSRGRPLRWAASLLVASMSAEVALLPIAAATFSRVTFAGLLLNFIAIPAMAVVQIAGMASIALAWWSPAADLAGAVAAFGTWSIVESARLAEIAPWLSVRVPPPAWTSIATYYAGWAAWCWAGHAAVGRPRWRALIRTCGLVAAGLSAAWIILLPGWIPASASGRLQCTFLDVGQADSTLVRFPDGQSWLIDTGGPRAPGGFDIGARVVSPALWALGVHRLDLMAITHGDPDHAGGALSEFADFRPVEVWEGVAVASAAEMATLRQRAAASGTRWRERRAGESVSVGGVRVLVHHPPPPDWERRKVRNDDSLVIEMVWRDVAILLPGDIGADVERGLVRNLSGAPLVVLKVPHHGSAGSSTPALLAAAHARVAVLSAGRGGWLARDLDARYRRAGASLFRTDRDGAITIDTNGKTLVVTTMTGRRETFEPRR